MKPVKGRKKRGRKPRSEQGEIKYTKKLIIRLCTNYSVSRNAYLCGEICESNPVVGTIYSLIISGAINENNI